MNMENNQSDEALPVLNVFESIVKLNGDSAYTNRSASPYWSISIKLCGWRNAWRCLLSRITVEVKMSGPNGLRLVSDSEYRKYMETVWRGIPPQSEQPGQEWF